MGKSKKKRAQRAKDEKTENLSTCFSLPFCGPGLALPRPKQTIHVLVPAQLCEGVLESVFRGEKETLEWENSGGWLVIMGNNC